MQKHVFDVNGEHQGLYIEGLTTLNETEQVVEIDIIDGAFHKMKLVNGQVVEGLTQAEIDGITGNNLEFAKSRKIKELDSLCKETILGYFKATINETEYEFSYDMEAQSRFNGIGLLFFANKITEIEWTAYENGERLRITLNQDSFDIVSAAALQHQNDNIIKYNQLHQQVLDAETKEEIELIQW